MKRKVVSYVRVSTDEQAKHGYSISAQRQVLKDYAKGHNLEIVREFEESQSAYKPGRPEFTKMLRFLQKHRDVTGVLCYKIDRIARNLRDYSQLSEMGGVSIISATEALPENSTGNLIATVQAAFSRYFSDQLSERVSLGLETKARKGYWPTYAPTGYVNSPDTKGIAPDPIRAGLIQELFETYARMDISLTELTQWARDRGLRAREGGVLAKSAIHKILTNPIYYGALPWKGVIYEGRHEPLISKALFDRVQERLKEKSSPRTKHAFPYRGLLKCGYCGCNITATLAKGKYIYYHCTHGRGRCPQPYFPQDRLAQRLQAVVEGVHLLPETVEMLLDLIQQDARRSGKERLRRLGQLEATEEKIRGRRDAAYMDKLDGKITEERWLEIDGMLMRRLDMIKDEREMLEKFREPSVDNIQATFELLERAPVLYMKQNHEERARLLKILVSNCRVIGENIEPIYKKPFDAVAAGVKTGEWLGEEDSNPH